MGVAGVQRPRRDQQPVKFTSEFIGLFQFALAESVFLAPGVRVQKIQLLRCNLLDQLVDDAAVDDQQHLIQAESLFERWLGDGGGAFRRNRHQAILRQADQGLAHDGARDAEQQRQLALVELGAWQQAPVLDGVRNGGDDGMSQHRLY